jgi:hypothetical protein
MCKVTFNTNKAQRFRKKSDTANPTKFYNLSESACEAAVETFATDPSLSILLRVITARSVDTEEWSKMTYV